MTDTMSDHNLPTASDVLRFWFETSSPSQWFEKDAGFDQQIRQRFAALHTKAAQGELFTWRTDVRSRLAEVIVLDQFSRNLYRDSAQAFAQDVTALVLAQEAINHGAVNTLSSIESVFLCMPYMHSESALIHEQAVALFTRIGMTHNLEYELQHKAIIDRFGRYPHRNAVLGRTSTAAELEFLQQPGSSF